MSYCLRQSMQTGEVGQGKFTNTISFIQSIATFMVSNKHLINLKVINLPDIASNAVFLLAEDQSV